MIKLNSLEEYLIYKIKNNSDHDGTSDYFRKVLAS